MSAPRRLQNFDFEVEYKKGTILHLADTLSRAYLLHDQIKGSKEDVFLTVDARSLIEQQVESVNELRFVSIRPQSLTSVQ